MIYATMGMNLKKVTYFMMSYVYELSRTDESTETENKLLFSKG